MTFANPPDDLRRISQLRDQIIIATSALEQLKVRQEEDLVEAIRWRQRMEIAWQNHRFHNWMTASERHHHHMLKSEQLQQQIEQHSQQVETWKAELLEQEQQMARLDQVKSVEQKFQQLLQLSQEALEDLKQLQA